MAIEQTWNDSSRVLHVRLLSPFFWTEIEMLKTNRAVKADVTRMGVLADFTEAGVLPPITLRHLRHLCAQVSPRVCAIAMVGGGVLPQTMVQLASSLAAGLPCPIQVTDSAEQAHAWLTAQLTAEPCGTAVVAE